MGPIGEDGWAATRPRPAARRRVRRVDGPRPIVTATSTNRPEQHPHHQRRERPAVRDGPGVDCEPSAARRRPAAGHRAETSARRPCPTSRRATSSGARFPMAAQASCESRRWDQV